MALLGLCGPSMLVAQDRESAPSEGETETDGKRTLLEKAPDMTVEQLEEMLQVHQRLGNADTVVGLAEVILERTRRMRRPRRLWRLRRRA